jgi:hypothetical protein
MISFHSGIDDVFRLTGLPALAIMAAVQFLVFGIPALRIAQRTGASRGWSVLAAVPFLGFAAYWILAFVRWPRVDG